MKLYYFPIAPNPTKVRLYLAEKAASGRALDVELVRVSLPAGEQKSPQHLARNPLGKLPVLELEDGHCLTESGAIIEYLEERVPEPALIGRTPLERAAARELERICDHGVLTQIARAVHATNSPLGAPAVPEVAAEARRALTSSLALIDAKLADGREFVAGSQPTIADCTLAAALQFGRFGKLELDPEYASIASWDARYRARDAVAAVFGF